jgi:hypothetical protein
MDFPWIFHGFPMDFLDNWHEVFWNFKGDLVDFVWIFSEWIYGSVS